jgi:hypothetical protein
VLGFLVGLAGIAGSITVVFLSMRSVLDVGGQCASGGPYVIATPCPDGTWLLPLAIFAGLGFTFLAIATGTTIGGIYSSLPGSPGSACSAASASTSCSGGSHRQPTHRPRDRAARCGSSSPWA